MDIHNLTQVELLEILRISRQTAVVMANEDPPLPSRKDGKYRLYDLSEVVPWMVERAVRKAGLQVKKKVEKSDVPDYDISEARKMAADAELAELKLARERGELLHLADYERAWADRIQRHSQGMASIKARVATRLGPEAAAVIDEEIGKVLGSMDQVKLEQPA